jgi:hypothetical protein
MSEHAPKQPKSDAAPKQTHHAPTPERVPAINLEHMDTEQIVQLQRLIGNQAVGKMIMRKAGDKTGLPDNLKSGIESLSGMSMDHVKVHYNSSKPAQLQALAYSQGSDIHVGPGQESHLPHEAWHVVQQMQGRVSPTMQIEGSHANDDPTLEKEADEMGAKAAGSVADKPASP